MQKFLLIGESGGSKTDWALLNKNDRTQVFSSPSLHPSHWSTYDFQALKELFESKGIDFSRTSLCFYGAGCNSEERQAEFLKNLSNFPFQHISINGDLIAAGIATLTLKNGYVCILGSGSVFIDYQKEQVLKYIGGLGRECGDEGAGYYFGKMVLQAFVEKTLAPIQESILRSVLSVSDTNQLNKGQFSEQLCLNLPFLLSKNVFEFAAFHERNLSLFFDKYVQAEKGKIIHFVGSYAYFHCKLLKKTVLDKGYELGEIIARPMDKLIPYFQSKLDADEL